MRLVVTAGALAAGLILSACGSDADDGERFAIDRAPDPASVTGPVAGSGSAAGTAAGPYDWVYENGTDVANCIGVVKGASVEEVLERYGADTSRELDPTSDRDSEDAYGSSIAAVAVDGGVVTVEPNGFQCSLPKIFRKAAAGHVAASVFWNVNGDNAFTLVRPDRPTASVDMYYAEPDEDAAGMAELGLPIELLRLWRRAGAVSVSDEGVVDPWAVGLAMVEKSTGIVVPREVVETPAPLYFLPYP